MSNTSLLGLTITWPFLIAKWKNDILFKLHDAIWESPTHHICPWELERKPYLPTNDPSLAELKPHLPITFAPGIWTPREENHIYPQMIQA